MRTLSMVAATCLIALVSTPAAASDPEPATSEPVANFIVTHDPTGDVIRTCQGVDGFYEQIRSAASGTMTSDDPRLTGTLETSEQILLNRTTLTGTMLGAVEITDPVTGAIRFDGDVIGVIKGVAIGGVMTGRLADGSFLVANFSAAHDPNTKGVHAIRGTIGAASAPPVDLAVIQSGGCDKWPPANAR